MSTNDQAEKAPTKIKISILIEVEYEPNPEHYEPNATLQQMLDVDLAGAKEDPYLQMDSSRAKWSITGSLT